MENNKVNLIAEVNNIIRYWNGIGNPYLRTEYAPTFHTWGTRKKVATSFPIVEGRQGTGNNDPESVNREYKVHRWGSWREATKDTMTHLNDSHKVKMGKATVKYFKGIY